MKKCNRCDEEIEFERSPKGYRPVNPDGSDHGNTCKKFKQPSPEKRIRDLDRKLMRGDFDEDLGVSNK